MNRVYYGSLFSGEKVNMSNNVVLLGKIGGSRHCYLHGVATFHNQRVIQALPIILLELCYQQPFNSHWSKQFP